MNSKRIWIAGGVLVACALAAWGASHPAFGDTWTVNFGNPGRDGTHTTKLSISYTDNLGAKKHAVVTANTPIDASMSEAAKATAVKASVTAALGASSVGGSPLASVGGVGDVMAAAPSGDSPGNFSDAKIDKVETDDSETGEDDTIGKPIAPAIGIVTAEGEITGQAGTSSSRFDVITELGVVSVPLTGSMRKVELLRELAEGLKAQGAICWVDSGRELLIVLLEDGVPPNSVSGLGAGSTDEGLHAVCTVIVQ